MKLLYSGGIELVMVLASIVYSVSSIALEIFYPTLIQDSLKELKKVM